jgi:hypothetical protein
MESVEKTIARIPRVFNAGPSGLIKNREFLRVFEATPQDAANLQNLRKIELFYPISLPGHKGKICDLSP